MRFTWKNKTNRTLKGKSEKKSCSRCRRGLKTTLHKVIKRDNLKIHVMRFSCRKCKIHWFVNTNPIQKGGTPMVSVSLE